MDFTLSGQCGASNSAIARRHHQQSYQRSWQPPFIGSTNGGTIMFSSTSSIDSRSPPNLEEVISAVLEIVDTTDFATDTTVANEEDNNASFNSIGFVPDREE